MPACSKRSKKAGLWNLIFVCVLCAVFLGWDVPRSASEEETVYFRWAFGALVGNGSNVRVKALGQDEVLKGGDKFKMMVELKKKCFVYVIYLNAQGELNLLFPYSLEQFVADYELSKQYFIPRGDAWFQLDDRTGRETFYLLASDERLVEVEFLFSQYASAVSERKPGIIGQMVAAIQNLESEHRDLLARIERENAEGRFVRGIERAQGQDSSDISSISQDISSAGFYARTFTIDHR